MRILATSSIFAALERKYPEVRIDVTWPLVAVALEARGIGTEACQVAAIATIAVETSLFSPIKERGGPAYLKKLYWDDERRRRELGNSAPEDAAAFCARGLFPMRGRAAYQTYGDLSGVNLVEWPARALEPAVAAELLAGFFWMRRINEYADRGDWEAVRRGVSGTLARWADFTRYVQALSEVAA